MPLVPGLLAPSRGSRPPRASSSGPRSCLPRWFSSAGLGPCGRTAGAGKAAQAVRAGRSGSPPRPLTERRPCGPGARCLRGQGLPVAAGPERQRGCSGTTPPPASAAERLRPARGGPPVAKETPLGERA